MEKMEVLRNTADGPSRRRWVWELLQNAVDVAPSDGLLEVQVDLLAGSDGPVLAFSHNGRPFTFKNLVYLAEQVSTKERHEVDDAEPESVGRFGTGFLTTHLLSERVTVTGVCVDEGRVPVAFALPLDRSGTTRAAMATGVTEAMTVLDGLDTSERLTEREAAETRTEFLYPLDAEGVEAARAGLNDLHAAVPYTLAFNERIGTVTAPPATPDGDTESTQYEVVSREALADGVDLVTIASTHFTQSFGPFQPVRRLVVARGGSVSIALPVEVIDGAVRLLPVPEGVPRLHCAFPLVGTEAFPFPAVVNSGRFHPTEPRDGVWLNALARPQQEENWALMAEARVLLDRVVAHAAAEGWRDLFVLAGLSSAATYPWLDADRYNERVRTPLRQTIVTAPLVETADGGRHALGEATSPGVWLPAGGDAQARAAVWALTEPFMASALPREEHVEAWHRVRWNGVASLTPEALANTVATAGTLGSWAGRLGTDESGAAEWLTAFVSFLESRDELALLDRPGKGVLPDQHGRFQPRRELFVDDEIADDLKAIAEAMGYHVRSELLDVRVRVPAGERDTRTAADVASDIRTRAQTRLAESPRSETTRSVFGLLLRWFHENEAEAAALFGDLYDRRHTLRSDEEVLEDMAKAERLDAVRAVLAEHGVDEGGLADALAAGVGDPEVRADAERYRQLLGWLQAEGASFESLPALLGEYRELGDPERTRGMSEEDRAMAAFVDELQQFADVELTSVEAFRAFVEARPDLFQHRSEADRYLLFLQKAERARSAVYEHLKGQPELYDLADWTPCPRRPTVILGVRRRDRTHGRPLLLVVRPSDGGRVIFYHREELAALADPEAELWTEDPYRGVRRLTLGSVLQRLREHWDLNSLPVAE